MKKYSVYLTTSLLLAASLLAETRYFVASPIAGDLPQSAFVIPISNPEDILQARYLAHEYVPDAGVYNGLGLFVSCTIAEGNGGINRDYGLSNRMWSWRVVEFEQYFDFTVNDDWSGNPHTIENDVAYYLDRDERDGVGLVHFNYHTITGELPFQPSVIHEDGWKESWFGDYRDDHFPWIGHAQYGDLYVQGMNPENIWFWSSDQSGWFFTRESHGDYLYRASDDTWLFRSESGLWFYNYKTATWEFGAL